MNSIKELLIQYQNDLFRYAMYLTGYDVAAWDLLQETSVRILTHRHHYMELGNFQGWARIVMKHIFFNTQKSLQRRSMLISCGYSEFGEESASVCEADSYYITNDMLALIDTLPPNQSRAFHLFIDGHSYADIAAKMSVSVDNVRNYIHSARVTLRRMLDSE